MDSKQGSLKVYDVPTRLFHWFFAAFFIGAIAIAKLIDDDSSVYPYHMILGMLLSVTVVFRLIWGVLGSRYARFSSFEFKPTALIDYFRELVMAKTTRRAGHNPASSWAAIIMMILALTLGVTGYLMTSGGDKEFYEEIHELCANAFLITALAHVGGVVLHTLRHRDWIGLSMIHGKKEGILDDQKIDKQHVGVGIVFLLTVMACAGYLLSNYDRQAKTLNLFGSQLELGENEQNEQNEQHEEHEEHEE